MVVSGSVARDLANDLELVETTYAFNVESVESLMQFDSIVLTTIDDMLDRLQKDLEDKRANLAIVAVQNHRRNIQNIRKNESVKHHYDTMLNQCVVLLVSHFASAMHDALRAGVYEALRHGQRFPVAKQEIKAKLGDLWYGQDEQRRADHIVELAIDQPGVSFQDMQSVHRTFHDYLTITTPRGPALDDIIIGQATRHCIVHTGGKATLKSMKMIGSRTGHRLNLRPIADQPIQFERDHVRALAASTTEYLRELLVTMQQTMTAPPAT
jgi:hypothetical protein